MGRRSGDGGGGDGGAVRRSGAQLPLSLVAVACEAKLCARRATGERTVAAAGAGPGQARFPSAFRAWGNSRCYQCTMVACDGRKRTIRLSSFEINDPRAGGQWPNERATRTMIFRDKVSRLYQGVYCFCLPKEQYVSPTPHNS